MGIEIIRLFQGLTGVDYKEVVYSAEDINEQIGSMYPDVLSDSPAED